MELNTERLLKFFTETLKDTLPIADFGLFKDSQTKHVIKRLSSYSKPITILDYGCGTFRLLNGIENNLDKLPLIQYYCTDKEKPSIFPGLTKVKYEFLHLETLRSHVKQYDVVVLMNVIHELSIHHIATIFEDIRRILKEDGELILVDMSILPEGESHSLPFYSWELKELFFECQDDSYVSKSGVPVVALSIPKVGIPVYHQFKSKLEGLINYKRDAYSAVASNLSLPERKQENKEFFVKLHLGDDYVHNFGYLLLLSGHANWRLQEEKRRVRGSMEEFNEAAKAILKYVTGYFTSNGRTPTLFELFDDLGKSISYDSLADSFLAMSQFGGFFFPVIKANIGINEIQPTETLDMFEDYYTLDDIDKMGLGFLQSECYHKISGD